MYDGFKFLYQAFAIKRDESKLYLLGLEAVGSKGLRQWKISPVRCRIPFICDKGQVEAFRL